MKAKAGRIAYHTLTGLGRPWIITAVKKGRVHLKNLDDAGEIDVPVGDFESILSNWTGLNEDQRSGK